MKLLIIVLSAVILSGCSAWGETKAPCTYYDREECGKEILINRG